MNFDKSPIQLSHLFRYIEEDRLSLVKCIKFVPKEIETDLIPWWKNFCQCKHDYKSKTILYIAMTCIKVLDLGYPIVPDFNKIINTYIKELCLPNDFKNLVLSLMLYQPYDYVKVNKLTIKKTVRIPDYESVAMAYVLIALKMCFGLDGNYELKVSETVAKINNNENRIKSYKIGMYVESTNRLFSFEEWTRFLQFRKILICQYYLPMARHYNSEVDDYVLMEHLEERRKRNVKLSDEVTMDILNKIPYTSNMNVIPKSEFLPSLIPLCTYTDVVLNIVPNDEIRLLLSEDFSQYNLKYAIEDLKLINMEDEVIVVNGIDESKLKIEPKLDKTKDEKRSDRSMVFVRNCENKNWLRTKPPALEHIKQNEDETIISDNGYESNMNTEVKIEEYIKEDIKHEYFEEEQEGINIFDDDFDFLVKDDKSIIDEQGNIEIEIQNFATSISGEQHMQMEENFSTGHVELEEPGLDVEFNENNFNKEAIINDLMALAMKKYKVKLPREYVPRPRKRKADNENIERLPKRQRRKTCDVKQKINDMIGSYYSQIETDILTKISEKVKEAFERQENNQDVNISDNLLPIDNNGNEQINEVTDHVNNSVNTEENDSTENINGTKIEEQNSVTNLNKENPDFDAKTHDIGQLFVKLKNVEIDESVAISEDPILDEIIVSKIEKFTNKKSFFDEIPSVRRNKINVCLSDDSCDEEMEQTDRNKEYFPPLISSTRISKFNYWLRFYNTDSITRYSQANFKFDSELKERYPASFCFVMNECTNIICCSTFNLYNDMQKLEQMILKKLNISYR